MFIIHSQIFLLFGLVIVLVPNAYAGSSVVSSYDFAEAILLDAFDEVLGVDEDDFLVTLNGDPHRALQAASYSDPVWWKRYKRQYGKAFKRCKWQNNAAPEDGSTCRMMSTGDYTCMFEDQTCPDGTVEPAIKCDCLSSGKWSCEYFKACASPDPITECPDFNVHPVTANPPLTCKGDFVCPFETETCCGDTFPKYTCECNADGTFDCKSVNGCINRICPAAGTCPNLDTDTPPTGKCSLPPDESCVYGEICCCDNCVDETTCRCDAESGDWSCATVAFKCASLCPPSIDGDKCTTKGEELGVGEISCCGSTLPEWVCLCDADGTYHCKLLHSKSAECVCTDSPVEQAPSDIIEKFECPGKAEDAPPFGISCSADEVGELCTYQETCCCNDCMDSTTCKCIEGGVWLCTSIAVDCMEPCPPAISGTACKVESEIVREGPEYECCGSMLPSYECTCVDGVYKCKLLHLPWEECVCGAPVIDAPVIDDPTIDEPTIDESTIDEPTIDAPIKDAPIKDAPIKVAPIKDALVCPGLDTDTPPDYGSPCSFPEGETCTYQETCCCDNCMDSTSCTCEDGTWFCATMAFGCFDVCPPAISGTSCSNVGETFTEGITECCGSKLPIWEITCSKDQTYHTTLKNNPNFYCLCAEEMVHNLD